MFHVELRQFPHQARVFNLTAEELHSRIASPWTAGRTIQLDDRAWDPGRAKLTIYEARELAGDEIGLGRGWGTVSRKGENVTARVLEAARNAHASPPALEALTAEVLAHASEGPLTFASVLDLAGQLRSDLSASERVDLATRAVLKVLEDGSLELSRPS